jgi:purine-nucleoside phosphorylase
MSVTTTEPLTAADRCDRCGAQAYVRVVLASGELYFCAHHGRKHAIALTEVADHIHDETERLHAEHGGGPQPAV